jgi:hypothetical protein
LSLTDLLRQALGKKTLKGERIPGDRTVAQHFVECLIAEACDGNASLAKVILDRIDGRLPWADDDGQGLDAILGAILADHAARNGNGEEAT